jgi:hypothetical protein
MHTLLKKKHSSKSFPNFFVEKTTKFVEKIKITAHDMSCEGSSEFADMKYMIKISKILVDISGLG